MVLDAGVSLNKPGPWPADDGEQEQRRIKAALIAEAYAMGGIDAMVLGAADWQLGTEVVRGWVDTFELPVLAANLTCDDVAPFPSFKVLEVDGHRLGVVGVTAGVIEGCVVAEAAGALQVAIQDMGPVDVVIGLLPYDADPPVVKLLDGKVPIDVAIDARGRHPAAGAEQRGGSLVIGAGSRGKTLGVLHLDFKVPDGDWVSVGQQEQQLKRTETLHVRLEGVTKRIANTPEGPDRDRLEAQRAAYAKQISTIEASLLESSNVAGNVITLDQVPLDREIADHPATQPKVEAAKQKITVTSGSDPRKFVPRIVSEGPYAGGEACVSCHTEEHLQWSRTAHARAWQGLVAENRALDAACWGCHVTGAKLEGGPQTANASAGFRDVQCEACHGAARDHIAAPDLVKPVRDPAVEVCTRCHDGEQDGGRFDLDTYRPKIVHGPVSE